MKQRNFAYDTSMRFCFWVSFWFLNVKKVLIVKFFLFAHEWLHKSYDGAGKVQGMVKLSGGTVKLLEYLTSPWKWVWSFP